MRRLAEVAHSRHEHPLCPPDLFGLAREASRVSSCRECAHHALEIVHSVVHDGNHNAPLVDGTPLTRGSSAVALSSERANALNAASTMWCGLSPLMRSRCTVRPEFSTRARKNSGVRNTS